MKKSEHEQTLGDDPKAHALRVAENALDEIYFDEKFKHGALFARLWFRLELRTMPRGYVAIPSRAVPCLCAAAKRHPAAFHLARHIAVSHLAIGRQLPADLAKLMAGFLSGDLKAPKNRRGPSPSLTALRNFQIYRMANRILEQTDLKLTRNAERSGKRALKPSASMIIHEVLESRKLHPPTIEMIEKVITNEKLMKSFKSIDKSRFRSLFEDLEAE